jgi:hypothetical protein
MHIRPSAVLGWVVGIWVLASTITLASDMGFISISDKAAFRGNFRAGVHGIDGDGQVTYSNGDVFKGQFKDGKPEGRCSITLADKTIYDIDFQNGILIRIFKTTAVRPVRSSGIEIFHADTIEPIQVSGIDLYQADTVTPVDSRQVSQAKAETVQVYSAESVEKADPGITPETYIAQAVVLNNDTYSSGSVSTLGSPDYSNPMVQLWTSHINALPYLINNGFRY